MANYPEELFYNPLLGDPKLVEMIRQGEKLGFETMTRRRRKTFKEYTNKDWEKYDENQGATLVARSI
jgi:hypothetical protein